MIPYRYVPMQYYCESTCFNNNWGGGGVEDKVQKSKLTI